MKVVIQLVLTVFLFLSCATTPISDRKSFILIPMSQEIALGKQAYKSALKDQQDSDNIHLTKLLRRLGKRIVKVSHLPNLDW